MLRGVSGAAEWLRRAEVFVVVVSIGLVLGSVVWGVLTRYVSAQPAAWTGEVAGIAFCWCGFIGSALIYAEGHPRIYEPGAIPSQWLRRATETFGFAVQAAVLLAVAILAFKQIGINVRNPTAVLRLPGSIYYVPVAWFSLSALARLSLRT
jgi:TRAP-type C4-dicarboxylate transport system permease small subunit